jgi:hypothetical protein
VPTAEVRKPRQAALDAASRLLKQGVIWANPKRKAEFTKGHWSYGSGEDGGVAFDVDAGATCAAFQTCYLFGAKQPDIVPQFAAVDPRCPQCNKNVASDFYQFINDDHFEDNVEEPFQCPSCGYTCRVDNLKDDVGIFISTFYVCFDDTNGSKIKADWLRTFSSELGIMFAVKEYWYT